MTVGIKNGSPAWLPFCVSADHPCSFAEGEGVTVTRNILLDMNPRARRNGGGDVLYIVLQAISHLHQFCANRR